MGFGIIRGRSASFVIFAFRVTSPAPPERQYDDSLIPWPPPARCRPPPPVVVACQRRGGGRIISPRRGCNKTFRTNNIYPITIIFCIASYYAVEDDAAA